MDQWKKFQAEREEQERREREEKQRRIQEEIRASGAVQQGKLSAEDALAKEAAAAVTPIIEGTPKVIKTMPVEGRLSGSGSSKNTPAFLRTASRSTPISPSGDGGVDAAHVDQKKELDGDISALSSAGAVARNRAALAALQAEAGQKAAAPAKIADVEPAECRHAGGAQVAIRGSGMLGAGEAVEDLQVSLCGCPVERIVSGSATEIVVVAGPATPDTKPGPGDVSVKSKSRAVAVKKGAFSYRPQPIITAVEPPEGPLAGGEELRIVGASLCDPSDASDLEKVEVCGLALEGARADGAGAIVGRIAPCGAACTGDVAVVSRRFGPARLPSGFAYLPRGRLAGAEPCGGPLAGGTRVRLLGENLCRKGEDRLEVTVGGVPVASVVSARETEIVVEMPDLTALGPCKVDVAIRSRRFGATAGREAYEVHRRGDVREVAPGVGPLAGGIDVAIRGVRLCSAPAEGPACLAEAGGDVEGVWLCGVPVKAIVRASPDAVHVVAGSAAAAGVEAGAGDVVVVSRTHGRAALAGAFAYVAASQGASRLAESAAEREAALRERHAQRTSEVIGDLGARRIVTERREELLGRVRALLSAAPLEGKERAACASAAHELLAQELDAVRNRRSGKRDDFVKFQSERDREAAAERQRNATALHDDLASKKAVAAGHAAASERLAAARERAQRILPTRRLAAGAEPAAAAKGGAGAAPGGTPLTPEQQRNKQALFAEKVAALRQAKAEVLSARVDSPALEATLDERLPAAPPPLSIVPDARSCYLDGPSETCGLAAALTLYLRDSARRHLWASPHKAVPVEARVRSPSGSTLPATVHDNRDGSFAIGFRTREEDLRPPQRSARYEVEVSLGGRPVGNSPYPMLVTRPELGAVSAIDEVAQSDAAYSEEELAACRRFDGVDHPEGGMMLDLVIVLDCTNSMQPYIDEVKRDLADVARLVRELSPLLGRQADALRVGLVAYRDYPEPGKAPEGGAWLLREHPLTADLPAVVAALDGLHEAGGDDSPEACEEALAAACALDWRPAAAKLALLVTDSLAHGAMLPEAAKWDRYPDGGPAGKAWHVELERCRRLGIALHAVDCGYGNGLAYLEYVERKGRAHFAAQDTGEASGAELDDGWRASVKGYYTSIFLFLRACAQTTRGSWTPVAAGAAGQLSAALYAHAEAALDRSRLEALVAARAVELREALLKQGARVERRRLLQTALRMDGVRVRRVAEEGAVRLLKFQPAGEADVEDALQGLLARFRSVERAPTRRAALDRLSAVGGALLAVAEAFEP